MPNRPGSSDGRRDPRNPRARPASQTQGISVDSVLGFTSEIPSGQPRGPPAPVASPITASATTPVSARTTADLRAKRIKPPPSAKLPALQTRLNQRVPQRSTKTTEKLVLLPDDAEPSLPGPADPSDPSDPVLSNRRPLRDEELDTLKKGGAIHGRSYAEWLPKKDRSDGNVARLTAYCGAHGYNVKAASKFLRETHGAKVKLYDDCLYAIYALPLLPGSDGFRVRSRPILKAPGSSRTVLDDEIERSEQRVDHSAFLGFQGDGATDDGYLVSSGGPGSNGDMPPLPPRPNGMSPGGYYVGEDGEEPSISMLSRLPPSTNLFAEMFIFSYGVVVFWNFSEQQERLVLADLEFADHDDTSSEPSSPSAGHSAASHTAGGNSGGSGNADGEPDEDALVLMPLDQDDFETEEFHFAYSADVSRPRIFNDMITLLPGSDHMIKLTISHAIAQSTKLCYFEERMTQTLSATQSIPKELAKTGQLVMKRETIMSIMGQLFKSRVELNLSSNILDTPKFFWDSEPTLHPLYSAIREYLELENRIRVLNERCQVFLDLTEILSDSIADSNMSTITWIIIMLIVVSIMVTVTEVLIRVSILRKNRDPLPAAAAAAEALAGVDAEKTGLAKVLAEDLVRMNISVEDLRAWSQLWTPTQRGAVCGSSVIGETWKEDEL
ncbi:hypothetical protein TD95_003779 [Thielaviopsis punctulata]|uniref:DUF155 domain-containing protein n=1 Tax=Thielaviopsis punctulata TaxID=72032 RepID=A0A0F4ZJA3_9PEZI|nr:hypothetical protein TD95_003779 [Thielaviopsis punctulata]